MDKNIPPRGALWLLKGPAYVHQPGASVDSYGPRTALCRLDRAFTRDRQTHLDWTILATEDSGLFANIPNIVEVPEDVVDADDWQRFQRIERADLAQFVSWELREEFDRTLKGE